MNGKGLKSPIFLFYLLVFYIALQFLWWIYLIFSLYEKIYSGTEELQQKVWMLLGEGSVFLLIAIIGIFMIRRAFKREIEVNENQQNFLMSVTHELKSPIASIKLQLQTLKARTLDEDKKAELYEQSLKEINRLDGLVANILLTKSIENNNLYLDKVNIELDELIREVVHDLRHGLLQSFEIDLQLENCLIQADQQAIRSLMTNLLENAGKYSKDSKKIIVRLGERNGKIVLNVIDFGMGISDENKGKVFDKFKRVESEMTRKSKGTGLGLFIVKHIVDGHGGTIQLKDNQPSGLDLEITFEK